MWMIPQLPSAGGATLWLAAFGEQRPADLVIVDLESWRGRDERGFTPAWKPLREDDAFGLWYARVELTGLLPDERYALWIRPGGGARFGAPAQIRTLPSRLPGPRDAPFVMMLGSCFDFRGTGGPAIADFRRVLADYRFPHLKILCGDQIYLDLPVTESIPHEPAELFRFLLGKYLRNWAPEGAPLASGFGSLLRHGANLLVTDDHEFWNNYPFAAAHVPFTYSSSRRRLLGRLSQAFIRAFQIDYAADDAQARGLTEITIGEPGAPGGLEIFAIDGRFDRSETLAHWPRAIARLCERLRGLRSPAMVVLSQPLFEIAQSALKRRFVDAGLPDLEDYDSLAEALASAPRDVMILSGDIHNGRIAQLRAGLGVRAGGDRKIVEVVASPLSLIPGTKYYDSACHDAFPSRPLLRGFRAVPRGVEMVVGPLLTDHAVVLEVTAKDRCVEASASFWSIGERRLIQEPTVITLT
ncbi:MAG: hypothetical protein R3B09_29005 [Nannocystaceae bacterium]